MSEKLRELLEGIIDYAGVFPPARLPLDEAVHRYLAHRSGQDAWIVNRFLCPAARLAELGRVLSAYPEACFSAGVIGSGGISLSEFETALEADARAMTAFEEDLGDRIEIEAYEVRRPEAEIGVVIQDLAAFRAVEVFLELAWDERQADDLAAIAETEWLGAKARTGGTEASAFPAPSLLASFLRDAVNLEVPFKLTAGLHEPLRHFDAATSAWHFGFLNVLAALTLHEAFDLSSSELESILSSEANPWTGSDFIWEDMSAPVSPSIRDLFVGFGSCSVEEPLAGLRKLSQKQEATN